MINAAQEFWRLHEELSRAVIATSVHIGPDKSRLNTAALVNATLSALDSVYARAELEELVAWATRHYVDEQQNGDLFIWSCVLLSVVRSGAASSLPREQRAAFEQAVTGRVGIAQHAADEAAEKVFESTAPSPFESRLAEQHPELHSLALESILDTLHSERAWQALVVLAAQLADLEGFLVWARDQASLMGIKPDLVNWRR
jgi:hypothetical protein